MFDEGFNGLLGNIHEHAASQRPRNRQDRSEIKFIGGPDCKYKYPKQCEDLTLFKLLHTDVNGEAQLQSHKEMAILN